MNTYAIGYNKPGYMPESEPFFVKNWREAIDIFGEDIERTINDEDGFDPTNVQHVSEAQVAAWLEQAKTQLMKGKPFAVQVLSWVHWVAVEATNE